MRTNLVLKFYCSECGDVLNIVTDYEKKSLPKPEESILRDVPNMPTGARMHQPDAIYIEPCVRCAEKINGPAIRLMKALNEVAANAVKTNRD